MTEPTSIPDPERGTPFTVSAAPADAGAVGFRLEGELDLQGVATLDAATSELAPGARAVIDLRELAFMDSSGVAALIKLDQRLRMQGGSVRCVVAPEGPVRKLVELTQLGEMLDVTEEPVAPAGVDPESGVDPAGGG